MANCPVCDTEYVEGEVDDCATCGWDLMPYPPTLGPVPEAFLQKERQKIAWAKEKWTKLQSQQQLQFQEEVMSQWCPIVFGATYEVDFRFIAIPEYFTPEDKRWARTHILATMRHSERLVKNPFWSIFKDEKHCVIGVTCMVEELISDLGEPYSNMTKDYQERPLYIFVGYVARVGSGQQLSSIPPYSHRELELFKPLYEYVSERWTEKHYNSVLDKSPIAKYKKLSFDVYYEPKTSPSVEEQQTDFKLLLNVQDPNSVNVWPGVEENKKELWNAVSQYVIAYQKYPELVSGKVSLCLGLVEYKTAAKGPFLNATADNVRFPKRIPKQGRVTLLQEQVESKEPGDGKLRLDHEKSRVTALTAVLGLVIASYILGVLNIVGVLYLIIGGSTGGSIGWMLAVGVQKHHNARKDRKNSAQHDER